MWFLWFVILSCLLLVVFETFFDRFYMSTLHYMSISFTCLVTFVDIIQTATNHSSSFLVLESFDRCSTRFSLSFIEQGNAS